MKKNFHYQNCTICPRNCGVDRTLQKTGVCRMTEKLRIARAALHFWEEPCISGSGGSGTVFFSGCSLHCVYCQNQKIANGSIGKEIDTGRLAEIFLELQEQGAHNINLVTGGHYLFHIIDAVERAKSQGLCLPIVYNTSSYEKVDSLKRLEGIVDIYLPDFKYMDSFYAKKYSNAEDYPQVAKNAIAEMVRQKPEVVFSNRDENGLMLQGVLVRQLLLPGLLEDAKEVTKYLLDTYGNQIYISLMSQYTPLVKSEDYPELARTVTVEEYEQWVDYAISIGIEQGFVQEGEVAKESFIPDFDCKGV